MYSEICLIKLSLRILNDKKTATAYHESMITYTHENYRTKIIILAANEKIQT